jgi:hypothetical protein
MRPISIRTLGALGPQQGEVIRVDGFPGRCRTLHTLSLRSSGYIGPVVIEASLSNNPSDNDWRPIHHMFFEQAPHTIGTTIKGKFVWMRVRYDETLSGTIDSVILR